MKARWRRFGLGLTARTAIGAAAVFVPFVAAVVVLSLQFFQRQYEQGIGRHQQLLARHIAGDVDLQVRSALQTLERVAKAVGPSVLGDPAEARRFLDERITLHLLFDQGLSFVGRDGRLLVESPRREGGRGRAPDGVWLAVARTGLPAISAPWSTGQEPHGVAITLAVPVRDPGGAVVGQLHGAVRVDGANVLGDLATVRIGEAGYFIVLTRDRVRLIHPEPSKVLQQVPKGANRGADRTIEEGFEGVSETVNSAGVELLTAAARIPSADWFLFANLPMAEVRAPFRAARPLYAGVVAAGAAVLVVAVWLSLRQMTRPLVRMTAAVERIAARPEPGRRIGGAGAGEVGRLGASFDRLLEALDARAEERAREEERRRALEVRLEEQQRLESLGVLAGGVAHDFNNLLTPVIANASLALLDLPADHPLRGELEEIVAAAQRGAELARRILAFGQRQVLATRVVDLDGALRGLEPALREVVGAGVAVTVEPAGVPARVRVDPAQLQQLLAALAANAREAMPGGGTLTITLRVPGRDGRTTWAPRSIPAGPYAEIDVTDTGHGMDERVRARVFEPFFTTKGRANSAGLGLPAVHGVVRQHGGDVEVESAPGRGATFRIYFPLAEEAGARAPAAAVT